jgi:hypothetical protein
VVSRFAVSRLTRQSTPDLSIDECASSSWVQSQHTIHHGFEESISQNLFIKPSLEPPQSEKWLQRQVISELTSMQDCAESQGFTAASMFAAAGAGLLGAEGAATCGSGSRV